MKNKMQNVSFRNVDDFLAFLPDDELEMTELLRSLVFSCAPEAMEKLSYNVPFYRLHKNFCFIWPASVLWGKSKTYEGVRFGFTNGYLLKDEIGYLKRESRKQVYWRDFSTIKSIDAELLKSYLYESLLIDEQINSQKAGSQAIKQR